MNKIWQSNLLVSSIFMALKQGAEVVIDSRKVTGNSIFWGLKGEAVNGSKFAKRALEDGALFVVAEDVGLVFSEREKKKLFIVDDSLIALQELAKSYRKSLTGLLVLGVTGSNGKTTTKELLRNVLGASFQVQATKGNFNNHIGVPLTLFSCRPEHELLICEMGANHKGEIDFLCNLADPDFGLITNIGKAHLEGFGGVEGIKQGKSELYRYCKQHNKLIFVDLEDEVLMTLVPDHSLLQGYHSSDVLPIDQSRSDALMIEADGETVTTNLIGVVNCKNIASAIAVAKYFKVKRSKYLDAIAAYLPTNNRSQLEQFQSGQIVLDCYNSNPTSLGSMLDHFLSRYEPSSLVFVLGDMLELGDQSAYEHQAIVDRLSKLTTCRVLLIGTEFGNVDTEPNHISVYKDTKSAKEDFDSIDTKGKVFLLKGSRGIKIESIIQPL